jgi:hypothetical protein
VRTEESRYVEKADICVLRFVHDKLESFSGADMLLQVPEMDKRRKWDERPDGKYENNISANFLRKCGCDEQKTPRQEARLINRAVVAL